MEAKAPEKIYVDNPNHDFWYRTKNSNSIEYTRTDVFIEKAVRFLKEWNAYRVCIEGHKDWFIEQFKNYMKGE